MSHRPLILSIFPGIGMLDRAFEEEGFTVVRGPDLLWGGDIRRFRAPAGCFSGVIGGDPCQGHGNLAKLNASMGRNVAPDLTAEYVRVVDEAQPEWFLRENLELAPDIAPAGYAVARCVLDDRWLGQEQSRRRRLWFGTRDGRRLDFSPELALWEAPIKEYVVTSKGAPGTGMRFDRGGTIRPASTVQARLEAMRRPWARLCELQGLPADFLAHAPFTVEGKKRVLANGVPLPMGRAIARAVKRAVEQTAAAS